MKDKIEVSADQFEAYLEEQNRLKDLYDEQEKRLRISEAISLLESFGYKIEKIIE